MIKRQRIGTNEYIVLHGDIKNPEAVFYVREFEGGEVRSVTEAALCAAGWRATLADGKEKVFSQKWLETVFLD